MTDDRELKNSIFAAKEAAERAASGGGGGAVFQQGGKTFISPTGAPIQHNSALDIELPVTYVPLPTNGLVYDQTSLKDVKEVAIRAMTAGDLSILMNRSLIKKGTVLTELMRASLLDKTIDVSNLTSGDRYAILFSIRIAAYGTSYEVTKVCPECESKNDWTIDLSQIPIKEIDMSNLVQVEPYKNEFAFMLPKCKKNIKFKFLTGHDEEAILRDSEAKKKSGLADDSLTAGLAKIIVEVEGERSPGKILQFCKNMPASDSMALRSYLEEVEPALDLEQVFTCSHCDYEEVAAVEIGPTLFWPNTRRSRSRIS